MVGWVNTYFLDSYLKISKTCVCLSWFGLVSWHINPSRLFNAKSSSYMYIKYIWFGSVGFYDISTIVSHLMPNPLHTYILNVYDLIWLGFISTIDTRLTKAWTAIDRLSIIWKSDLTDKMKRNFFQAAVVSILLYGCTTWTLTKRLEKKLDGNYARMLRAILNKSWRQHPTRHQIYGHLPPITKTIQVRRARHVGHCWRSKDVARKWCTPMDPHIWPSKSRTTSPNLHTASMWGHGM